MKFKFFTKWVISNITFAVILTIVTNNEPVRNYVIMIFAVVFTGVIGVRSVGSILYYLKFYCFFLVKQNKIIANKKSKYEERAKKNKERLIEYFSKQ